MTAKIDPVGLDGEIGRWRGNRRSADQWGRGLIAGQKFSDRLELYAELQDLQDIDKIGGAAKQRELTLDKLDKSDKGGRGIQAATKHNSEPNWIAYLGGADLVGAQGMKRTQARRPPQSGRGASFRI